MTNRGTHSTRRASTAAYVARTVSRGWRGGEWSMCAVLHVVQAPLQRGEPPRLCGGHAAMAGSPASQQHSRWSLRRAQEPSTSPHPVQRPSPSPPAGLSSMACFSSLHRTALLQPHLPCPAGVLQSIRNNFHCFYGAMAAVLSDARLSPRGARGLLREGAQLAGEARIACGQQASSRTRLPPRHARGPPPPADHSARAASSHPRTIA